MIDTSSTTKWISEIEEEMISAKQDCSESKSDMNSFGYGYDLGMHDGLRKALQIITGKTYVE
jgi:hypothetical protein